MALGYNVHRERYFTRSWVKYCVPRNCYVPTETQSLL